MATTRRLAELTSDANPSARFIFLSSVLVYGEHLNRMPVSEQLTCHPACDYSRSKLEAEVLLKKMFDDSRLDMINILRLAQVYDVDFSDNLDKRVFSPFKLCYLKLGRGQQRMSALSRRNFIDFLRYLIERNNGNISQREFEVYNVSDKAPYSFWHIIQSFRRSNSRPNRPVLPVPFWAIRISLRILAAALWKNKDWVESCYNKLTLDFIYDNNKMLQTGFMPIDTIDSVFLDNPDKS